MNCLCCGKPLPANAENDGWHKACISNFFGTKILPEIDISEDSLISLATESTTKGLTVPGVQKKLSLQLQIDTTPRLTLVNYPTGFILKPQVSEYASLPESENLVMCMADTTHISTVPHALVKTRDSSLAYITKRVDRVFKKSEPVSALAMEDFCQLDLRLTQDKYKGSYERCAKIIEKYSSRPGIDMSEFYLRLVFSFIVGNSDMHLKNFSLIENQKTNCEYILSPAYDLLPVNSVMPQDKEQFALTMNGKKTNLRRKDFLLFAENCGLSEISATRIIQKVVELRDTFISMNKESLMSDDLKTSLEQIITERSDILA